MDPDLVIVSEYIPEYDRLHLGLFHPVGRDPVQQFLLKRSKEALHTCLIVTIVYATETLGYSIGFEFIPEFFTGVLAFAITVQDGASYRVSPCCC